MDKGKRTTADETFSLMDIHELKVIITQKDRGILFCFGTSFISQLIQAKTRLYPSEIVPSHVAIIYDGYIYESTTDDVRVNNKHIKSGVRRWQLKDFFKSETSRNTLYYFSNNVTLDLKKMEHYIHYPYGKDTIVDYLLTDDSKGDSKGLICSQYANLCSKLISNKDCVTPAELYRKIKEIETDDVL